MGILARRRLALLIAALHLALGSLYSVAVPLWEAYDEWGHYPYIRYIATARSLPPRGGPISVENDTARGQPPLYYILGAAASYWIDSSDYREPVRNPYSSLATAMGGYNRALHDYNEDFPWRGSVLAVHVVRFLSVLLSTVTVWFTYLIGRTLFPRRPAIALGAMAIAAFWPQFLFIGSVINNDNLINCMSTLLLWLMVRNVVCRVIWADRLALAGSLVLAIASKAIGVMLVPLALFGLAVPFFREARSKGRRRYLLIALILLSGVALIAAVFVFQHPRYITRIQFFLHPRALSRMTPERWLGVLQAMWGTLWASFGWQSVGIDAWVYRIVEPIWLLALAGLAWFFVRGRDQRVRLALAALALSVVIFTGATLYRGLFSSYYWTGRYLLGTIGAFSTLLAVGLAHLGPRRLGNGLLSAVCLAMFVFALYAPFTYILPVYARPNRLPESALAVMPNPVHVRFGDGIELTGYDVQPRSFQAGQTVQVSLYWRCLTEMETNYTLAVKLLGPADAEYAGLNVHPGRGNYPTSLWKAADFFRDTYYIPLPEGLPAPSMLRLKIAFFRTESALLPIQRLKVADDSTILEHLPASDPQGQPLGFAAILGRFRLAAGRHQEAKTPQQSVDYRFGPTIRLLGYDLPPRTAPGADLPLSVYWNADGSPDRSYTVFVHVIDAEGKIAAQTDGQPVNGNYPTDLWGQGDSIVDTHLVSLPADLPAGDYTVAIGLYSPDTQERQSIRGSAGDLLPNAQVLLGSVRIAP